MSQDSAWRDGNPASAFQGKIGRLISESQPWWPAPVKPPAGAPNILILYCDDLGFSDLGCFGSEIATPNIDRLAEGGLRFTNYTTVPMCSPARAALLTGKNPHAVGCGWIAHANPGYPGYNSEISQDAPTLAEMLKVQGYSTMMVGKWHNTWGHHVHDAADRSSWPLQRGFERFYGFLDAETNYFSPDRIYEGNQLADIDSYSDDYFATDAWTDRALVYMKSHVSSEPHKPFFMYMAFNAPHMPIQAKSGDMARYKGRYAEGWDRLRTARAARQTELGLFDRPHPLAPMPPGVPAWDSLDDERRELFAHYMELYAALVDNIDQNVGRVLDFLEASGQLGNTLIVFSSDNGASAVGGLEGTPNFMRSREGQPTQHGESYAAMKKGVVGGPESMPAYPTGWAQVSNTPFYYFKRTPMMGGIRVPFIMHWPKGIAEKGAVRKQWVHVTDITPTLMDVIGLTRPDHIGDLTARQADGKSFKSVLSDAKAPAARSSQHYELEANRAYILGDWKIVSLQTRGGKISTLDNWMLFNLANDPTECHDLAAEFPDKVKELEVAFDAEAWSNNVYPLDARALERAITLPPHLMESVNTERVFYPGTQTISRVVVSPLITDRNFSITARFDWQAGQEGVIWALGEAFTGLALYVTGGSALFVYHRWMNPLDLPLLPLTPGAQCLRLEFEALGQRQGRARLALDGGTTQPWTDIAPTVMSIHCEGMDVGLDRRQRVSSRFAERGTFAYPGVIHSVTVTPGPQAPGSVMNQREDLAQQALGEGFGIQR
ncbi:MULTISPECIES: arylsulfatase [Comamonas]|uniref:arylsulfatase n=1 Tax=Comamonas TaxID=283 RepID=UPI0015FD715B|nr:MULTISPECIES: arylsulfatase [Comamonas]UUC95033.1 arylsulfatase [Comamonas sp. C11]